MSRAQPLPSRGCSTLASASRCFAASTARSRFRVSSFSSSSLGAISDSSQPTFSRTISHSVDTGVQRQGSTAPVTAQQYSELQRRPADGSGCIPAPPGPQPRSALSSAFRPTAEIERLSDRSSVRTQPPCCVLSQRASSDIESSSKSAPARSSSQRQPAWRGRPRRACSALGSSAAWNERCVATISLLLWPPKIEARPKHSFDLTSTRSSDGIRASTLRLSGPRERIPQSRSSSARICVVFRATGASLQSPHTQ